MGGNICNGDSLRKWTLSYTSAGSGNYCNFLIGLSGNKNQFFSMHLSFNVAILILGIYLREIGN